jgi:hypothetical protein
VIEDFIGKVYRERYGKAIEATWLSTIFSMAVSAFLVGGIMGALSGIMYCVRDINAPIYFHQTTNIFLMKFGVMIILTILRNLF